MKLRLSLLHLYPEAMNLYGDHGNIVSIVERCRWRGIEVELLNAEKGPAPAISTADILFMGGGPDSAQRAIGGDFLTKGAQIREAMENGACALTICGAYQLFGHYFKTKDGVELPGIGIFDAFTEGSDERMIGNALIDARGFVLESTDNRSHSHDQSEEAFELVGFENHSGKTHLGKNAQPLGRVICGYGNDGASEWEGCRYKNAFGTYLHGPLLPKNPWFTDLLIELGLEHRYGRKIELEKLDDSFEAAAFKAAKRKAMTAKTTHL